MESVYENLKNHFRRKLSCFRLELLGFDLLKGVAVVLFTFLLFLFFYAGLLSFFRLLPDFKYVLYLILFLLLGVEFFFFILLPFIRFFFSFRLSRDILIKQISSVIPRQVDDIFISVYNLAFRDKLVIGQTVLKQAAFNQKYRQLTASRSFLSFPRILYLKLSVIVVFLFVLFFFTGFEWYDYYSDLKDYRQVSGPSNEVGFHILNRSLEVEYGKTFQVQLSLSIPNATVKPVFICYGGGEFLMTSVDSIFTYDFELVNNDLKFYFKTQDQTSDSYLLRVLPTPSIDGYRVVAIPPAYTGKEPEILTNTVDLQVLYGSVLQFELTYSNLDSLFFEDKEQSISIPLKSVSKTDFSRQIKASGEYILSGSNAYFSHRQLLNFNIICISDLYPGIQITEIQDSLKNSLHYFYGVITDDYGFSDLCFNYSLGTDRTVVVPVSFMKNLNTQEFYFSFDFAEFAGTDKTEINYYFEVFDNDNLSGPKSTRSSRLIYRIPDLNTIFDYNREVSQSVNNDLKKAEKIAGEIVTGIQDLRKKLLDNTTDDWEKQQLSKEVVRKKEQLDRLLEAVKENNQKKSDLNRSFTVQDSLLIDKQKKIQDLLDRLMDSEIKQLLDEFSKLSEEFSKDKFKNLDERMEFTFDQVSEELDRNIELLKRFQIEERHDLISKQIDRLKSDQARLERLLENKSFDRDSAYSRNKSILNDLRAIENNYEELITENSTLSEPFDLKDFKTDFDRLSWKMQQQRQNISGNKKDKKLSEEIEDDLFELSKRMKQQQERNFVNKSLPQNDIELIIQNILIISLSQEELLQQFSDVQAQSLKYNELGRIQDLKRQEYKIIKDSLSVLAKSNLMLASLLDRKFYDLEVKFGLLPGYIQDNRRSDLLREQHYIINYLNDIALSLTDALQKAKEEVNRSGKRQGEKNSDKERQRNSSGDSGYPKMKQFQRNLKKQLEDLVSQMKNGEKGKPLHQRISNMIRENELFRKSLNEFISEAGLMSSREKQLLNEINQLIDQNIRDMANYSVSGQLINRNNLIYNKLLMSEKASKEKEDFEDKRKSESATQTRFHRPEQMFEFQKKSAFIKTDIQKSDLKLNTYFKSMYNHYYIKLGNE